MKPIVYVSSDSFDPKDVAKLPLQALERDWTGLEVSSPVSFCLVLDPNQLIFVVEFPNSLLPNEKNTGTWRSRLWEGTVAELFVAQDNGTGYQEFNLSPSGEWWSEYFVENRVPSDLQLSKMPGVEVFYDDASGRHQLNIGPHFIKPNCAFDESSRLNVCSITGDDPRYFCSSCKLPGEKADFHQAQHFDCIEIRELR